MIDISIFDYMRLILLSVAMASLTCSILMIPILACQNTLYLKLTGRTMLFICALVWLRAIWFYQIPIPTLNNRAADVIVTFVANPQRFAVSASNAINTSAAAAHVGGALDKLTAGIFAVWIFHVLRQIFLYFWEYRQQYLLLLAYAEDIENPAFLKAVSKAKESIGLWRPVQIHMTSEYSSPCTIGMLFPHIFFPIPLVDYYMEWEHIKEQGITLISCHEFAHIKHNDVAWQHFIHIVCAVHWANPLFEKLLELWLKEIEPARDRNAVKGRSAHDVYYYGTALCETMSCACFGLPNGKEPIMSYAQNAALSENDTLERMYDLYRERSISVNIGYGLLALLIFSLSVIQPDTILPQARSFDIPTLLGEESVSNTVTSSILQLSSPIANPTEVTIPSVFERNPQLVANRLMFAADAGTEVYAPIEGEVVYVGYLDDMNAYMDFSIIIQNSQFRTTVGHLASANVQIGDIVNYGSIIGTSGRGGKVSNPGCEIEITDLYGAPVDLNSFISSNLSAK